MHDLRSERRIAAACIAVLLSAACVRYEPKPISALDHAVELEGRSLSSPDLREFLAANRQPPPEQWPLPAWDDESLELAAFHYHPDLAVARAEWATVYAGRITAGQRPEPSLEFIPQYNTTTPTALISPWILPINLGLRIETAGKRGARKRRATQLSRAAWWNIASMAWAVRRAVQTSLLRLQQTRELADLLEDRWEVHRELVAARQRLFDAGAISRFELAQTRVRAQALHLAQLDARRQVGEAEVRLAGAIGIPVTALEGVTLRFVPLDVPLPPVPLHEARRQALLNRTDILAALAEYEGRQEALQVEIARQYPDIQLGPGYEYDQGMNKWALGLSLTLPVINRNRGPIAEAEAGREEAAIRFESLQTRVLGEIDLALAAFGPQAEQTSTAASIVELSVERERRARERYELGQQSRVDLLSARAESLKAREDLLLVRAAGRQAYLDLENALQSPARASGYSVDAVTATISGGQEETRP